MARHANAPEPADPHRPGRLTRLLLTVLGPADISPPDDRDRRAQVAYRAAHPDEHVEAQGVAPHRPLPLPPAGPRAA